MGSILGQFGNGGVRLGRIAGIPVTLDWSWFPIAFLFVLSVSGAYAPVVGTVGALFVGLAMATGFFGSILAHEFGHALTARRFGIRTESIALHVFGGVARITSEARTPRQEFLIAAAGPAVSFGLAALFWLFSAAIPDVAGMPVAFQALDTIFGNLAFSNLVLGAFNLIPGFPLDGGRILRAIVWQHRRSRPEGTRVAARWGRRIGLGMMGLGGALAIAGPMFQGIMLVMLGYVIREAARSEAQRALYRPVARAPRIVRLPTGEVVILHE